MKRDAIKKAFSDAGFRTVELVDQKVFVDGKELVLTDVICEPVLIDPDTRNYLALTVAARLGLKYREHQEFSGASILRWAEVDDEPRMTANDRE